MIRAWLTAAIVAATLSACSPEAGPAAPEGARHHVQDDEACRRQPDMPWCTE